MGEVFLLRLMDQETHESKRIGDVLCQDNGMTSVNSSNSVNGVVANSVSGSSNSKENWDSGLKVDGEASETAVTSCEQNRVFGGEKEGFGLKIDEMGSSGAVVNALEACNEQEIGEPMGQNDPGSSGNSSHLVDVVVLETVILVHSDQTACFSRGVKSNELGSSKALVENLNGKVSETEKESCVIDVKCGNGDGKEFKESSDGERVCRICHLSSEQPPETAPTTNATSGATSELIRLGCGCKDELGIAHSHCAEAWFKLKGNR